MYVYKHKKIISRLQTAKFKSFYVVPNTLTKINSACL